VQKINVSLTQDNYSLLIGQNIFNQFREEIDNLNLYKNLVIIIDENVAKFHMSKIRQFFSSLGKKINYYFLKPSEAIKSYRGLNNIYSFMLEKGYGRDTLVIAIGGGVTGDLVGFAAATFMRGVQLVHVPTTLLAAVDSSIGGKTGINFQKKKNMIGSFYQPKTVVMDIDFFKTLPKREITSGIGEVIKYGFLADSDFFDFLKKNINQIYSFEPNIIEKIVVTSAGIKTSVVSSDEKEFGARKILNLGHTFAHGLESEFNFKIKHGEAVIAGCISALFLSAELGLLNRDYLEEYLSLPLKIKLPNRFKNFNINNVIEIMKHDKKNRDGKIKFVLPVSIGNILIDIEAEKNVIASSIKKMIESISY